MFRLVATDLDQTLLRSDYEVSERAVDAVAAVRALGVPVVPVTARAPWSLPDVLEPFAIDGLAVCNSGATIYDIARDTIVEERLLDHAVALELARAVRAVLPEAAFAAASDGGYAREASYIPGLPPPAGSFVGPVSEFLTAPVHKLVVRHPELSVEDLLAAVAGVADGRVSVGSAGGTFVEVLGAGASKAAALARTCDHLGVRREEVVAFGDFLIDAEMLAWAGHGVAVANAHPVALAAADEVTASNDQDGVALVLERLLSQGRLATA